VPGGLEPGQLLAQLSMEGALRGTAMGAPAATASERQQGVRQDLSRWSHGRTSATAYLRLWVLPQARAAVQALRALQDRT
jgi:hypothetical protein